MECLFFFLGGTLTSRLPATDRTFAVKTCLFLFWGGFGRWVAAFGLILRQNSKLITGFMAVPLTLGVKDYKKHGLYRGT